MEELTEEEEQELVFVYWCKFKFVYTTSAVSSLEQKGYLMRFASVYRLTGLGCDYVRLIPLVRLLTITLEFVYNWTDTKRLVGLASMTDLPELLVCENLDIRELARKRFEELRN